MPRPTPRTFVVYLLRCRGDAIYCGMTNDLPARLAAHNDGRGARFTRSRLPVELAWRSRRLPSRSHALRLEAAMKKLTRRQKLAIIAGGAPPRLAPRKATRA